MGHGHVRKCETKFRIWPWIGASLGVVSLMPRSHQTFRSVLKVKLLGIMLRNRWWSITFLTMIAGDADGWCWNCPVWSAPHTKVTPGGLAKNINPTYSPEIQGWDFSWLDLLVARLPLSSNHSSSSSQLKSQPCISGEYVGLMFLVTEAARVFGVTPDSRWLLLTLGGHSQTVN